MPIPKNISPEPILEAVVEFRFESSLPPDAVFGVIYSTIKDGFKKPEQLPIIQLPERIRANDPNLKYQPLFSLSSKDNLHFRIGPRVLTFSNTPPYVSWIIFSQFVNGVINKIDKGEIFAKPERIGIRYVNFFKYSILDKINASLSICDTPILDKLTNIRTEIPDGDYLKIIQIANNVTIQNPNYSGLGSLIDIDCIFSFEGKNLDFSSVYSKILDEAHAKVETQFFTLLKQDLINQLNPKY